MAHELDITNGIANYAGAHEPAWHRLGITLDHAMTVDEALTAANLRGWNVRKVDLAGTDIDENGVTTVGFDDHRGVVRTNPHTGATDTLGVVGKGFHLVQNEEHGEFLEALLDQSGARFIETAGALRGGRQVFYCAKLPEGLSVGGVDDVDLYISAMNGHDGSAALSATASPVRIVCANTQAANLRAARQRWATRHTAGASKAIEDARQALDLVGAFNAEFGEAAERLINTDLVDAEFEKLIGRVFGTPDEDVDTKRTYANKVERLDVIRGLYHDAATQASIRGTRWGAYQAIGEYVDHFATVRAKGDDAKREARALAAVDGGGAETKRAAWNLLAV